MAMIPGIAGICGCSAVPSVEEMGQLDDLRAEIQSLQQEKQSLENQQAELAASISRKEAQLQSIEDRKNTLIQMH